MISQPILPLVSACSEEGEFRYIEAQSYIGRTGRNPANRPFHNTREITQTSEIQIHTRMRLIKVSTLCASQVH